MQSQRDRINAKYASVAFPESRGVTHQSHSIERETVFDSAVISK